MPSRSTERTVGRSRRRRGLWPALVLAIAILVAACAASQEVDDGAVDTPTPPTLTPPTTPALPPPATGATTPADPDRPNVVVIMTDDQIFSTVALMPNTMELLVGQGTSFPNSYAVFPLCCPSRATFLTGQYAKNHGVRNNVPPDGGNDKLDQTNTLAVWLTAAGYQTSQVGKFLNGYGLTSPATVPPGWGSWFGLVPTEPGIFDQLPFFDYDVLDDGQLVTFGNNDEDYQTDVLADRAVAEIERMSADGRPFFLNFWTVAPHAGKGRGAPNDLSPAPAPRDLGTFADGTLPDVPSIFEEDVSDKPAYLQTIQEDIAEALSEVTDVPLEDLMVELWQANRESLGAVDDAVGEIVAALEAAGELDNTIIIFTTDNGLLVGQHRLPDVKIIPYEETIRVPLIVRGPGFGVGEVVTTPVANIDLAPTIVDAAGATAGRTMDGVSLYDVTADPDGLANRAFLLEGPPGGTTLLPGFRGLRIPGYVLIEYVTGETEFYDLTADPYQLDNGADDPANAATIEALSAVIDRMEACTGAGCQISVPVG